MARNLVGGGNRVVIGERGVQDQLSSTLSPPPPTTPATSHSSDSLVNLFLSLMAN